MYELSYEKKMVPAMSRRISFRASWKFLLLNWACTNFLNRLKFMCFELRLLAAGKTIIGPSTARMERLMFTMVDWIEYGNTCFLRSRRFPPPLTEEHRSLQRAITRESIEMTAMIKYINLKFDEFIEDSKSSDTINTIVLTRLLHSFYNVQTNFYEFCEQMEFCE
jgi:hypothetical protein